MKVKIGKKPDIVDALKHLKITDRRSRPLLKGRTISTLASLGESQQETSKLLRLSQSTSLTNPLNNYDIGCCRACEFCHMIGTANLRGRFTDNQNRMTGIATLEGTMQNETISIPPFTKSAGLLYTTLPTKWNHRNLDSNLPEKHRLIYNRSAGPSYLRRSFGTELSHLDEDNDIEKIESSSSVSSTAFPVDRLSCCCRHEINITLPVHLRLYRWLYSLVDHPCVSLYYSCRYHTLTNTNSSRGSSVISNSHRHSLNLRHRHTTTPTSAHNLSGFYTSNTHFHRSFCSKSPDTTSECGTNISSKNTSTFSELNDRSILSCGSKANVSGVFPAEIRSLNTLGNNTNVRSSGQSKFGGRNQGNSSFNVEDEQQNIGNQRCRRNSDPEQWQQMRTSESNDEQFTSSFDPAVTGANGTQNSNSMGHAKGNQISAKSDERTICINNPSDLRDITVSRTLGEISQFAPSFRPNLQSHSTCFTNAHPVSQELFNGSETRVSELNRSDVEPFRFAFTQMNPTQSSPSSGSQPFSDTNPTNQIRSSLFRPSVLSSNLQMELPSRNPPHFSLSTYPNHNPCGDGGLTERSTEQYTTKSSDFSPYSKSIPISYPDFNKLSLSANQDFSQNHVDSTLEPNSSVSGIDLLPNQSRSQLNSDISVNELASYMEHMVHIPGRMSEMAQRMYL